MTVASNILLVELEQMKKELNFVGESADGEHAKAILFELMKTTMQVIVIRNPETTKSQAHKFHKWIRSNYYCTPIRGGWIVRAVGTRASAKSYGQTSEIK